MTDIGGHSAGMLPHLAEHADVIVWTTQASPAALGRATVRLYAAADPPYAALNAADATFYNFGNNAQFHRDIFQVASQVPGIAILHDLNLQHFFAGLAQSQPGQQAYLQRMRRYHGPAGGAAAERFLAGEAAVTDLVEKYPLSLGVSARALAVITHNEAGLRALQAETRLPVYYVPLSLDGAGVAAPRREPARPPFRLIVFGHIGSNRRLPSVLRALTALPTRALFTLDVYGALEEQADTERLIGQLGLRDQVVLHGYVPAAELAQALAGAHLAINLRYPTMGEASGSQLRLWTYGLPSLVTRTGWYAALPEDAVMFVDPEDEHAGLLRHLAAFPDGQSRFIAAGQRGQRIAATVHAPEAYAGALLRIAEEGAALHRRRGAIDLAHASAHRGLQVAGAPGLPGIAPAAARAISELFGAPLG